MAAAQWCLPRLRFWVGLLSLLALCSSAEAKSKDEDKSKKKKGKSHSVADVSGPKKWGDPKFWVNIKGMGFSEGNLRPNFNETTTDYKLTIRNGKAQQLLVTVQLDTDKYNLQQLPDLVWNGKVMKYSPIETIEFTMPLNETIGPLHKDATLTCKDHNAGSLWAPTNSKTYKIAVEQYPDIEQIVTAKSITVHDAGNDNREFIATPPYSPKSNDNEIIYYVNDTVEKVNVKVECPGEATRMKYNGKISKNGAEYSSHAIDGASTSILAQCIYEDQRYTHGKEMQRTYVIKILRNHGLTGTDVSVRIWPPANGRCEAYSNNGKDRDQKNRELKNDQGKFVKQGNRAFKCMGYSKSVPLLSTYNEPKAELVVVNTVTKATYRLWNGIPSHIPLTGPPYPKYQLVLQAGVHKRIYDFDLSHPPTCDHIQCQNADESVVLKGRENEGPLIRWSHKTAKDAYCLWEPCNITRDWGVCCAKKRASCVTYEKCQESAYRTKHPQECPTRVTYKGVPYNYEPTEKWSCKKKGLSIAPGQLCAWTPCLPNDNDDQQCCAKEGAASCDTMKCPDDMVKKAGGGMCSSIPCAKTDIPVCCELRDICTSMKCPIGYSLKYNAALFLCDGAECGIDDREQCCDNAAYCDTWTCPPLWTPKKDNGLIKCGGYPCMEWDTGLCCNMKGMCSTLTCPAGFYLKEHATTKPCAGIANRSCNLGIDLDTCCSKAAVCEDSYVCDKKKGYALKLNSKLLSCDGIKCTSDDRIVCCDLVDPFKAASTIVVVPREGEGSCEQKDHDGDIGFNCKATGSQMHLMVNLTFDSPVGNPVYFGKNRLAGRAGSYPLPPIEAVSGGKRYTLPLTFNAAGRGRRTSKISIYVEQGSAGSSSTKDSKTHSSVLRKLSEPLSESLPESVVV